MLKKLASLMLAVTLAFSASVATMDQAEARGGRFAAGVAAGVIGLGLLGAYAHAREDRGHYRSCYGPERCEWRNRHCFENRYGEWVCRGGRYVCWRPEYC